MTTETVRSRCVNRAPPRAELLAHKVDVGCGMGDGGIAEAVPVTVALDGIKGAVVGGGVLPDCAPNQAAHTGADIPADVVPDGSAHDTTHGHTNKAPDVLPDGSAHSTPDGHTD